MKGIKKITQGNDSVSLKFTEQNTFEGDVTLDDKGFNFSKQVGGSKVALTYAATIPVDLKQGNIFDLTLTGNVTSLSAVNSVVGNTYIFVIRQDAVGSHTLSFASNFHFEGGTAPTITATASAVDVVSAVYDGTNMLCSIIQDIKVTS